MKNAIEQMVEWLEKEYSPFTELHAVSPILNKARSLQSQDEATARPVQEKEEGLENELAQALEDILSLWECYKPKNVLYTNRENRAKSVLDKLNHPSKATEDRATQRQDSLQDQLSDVRKAANGMGCYDAEAWIVSMSGRTFNAPANPPLADKLVEALEELVRSHKDVFYPSIEQAKGADIVIAKAREILAKFKEDK